MDDAVAGTATSTDSYLRPSCGERMGARLGGAQASRLRFVVGGMLSMTGPKTPRVMQSQRKGAKRVKSDEMRPARLASLMSGRTRFVLRKSKKIGGVWRKDGPLGDGEKWRVFII